MIAEGGADGALRVSVKPTNQRQLARRNKAVNTCEAPSLFLCNSSSVFSLGKAGDVFFLLCAVIKFSTR